MERIYNIRIISADPLQIDEHTSVLHFSGLTRNEFDLLMMMAVKNGFFVIVDKINEHESVG